MESTSEKLYNQFSKGKKQQKYIWLSAMTFFTISFISMLVFLYLKSKQVVVISENGKEVEAVVKNKAETFEAYAKEHIDKSFMYLNSFDRFTLQQNKGKVLFYIDSRSVKRIWREWEKDGVFADVQTLGVTYESKVDPKSIIITGDKEPFNFICKGLMKVQDKGTFTNYEVTAKGQLIYYAPKYPVKPTGFYISEYSQNIKLYE